MSIGLTGTQLIDGKWLSEGGPTFAAVNPATGAALEGRFHNATAKEIDAAFAAAAKAYAQVRDLPAERFAALLEAIAAEIEALGDTLLDRAAAESALAKEPRLVGERGRTTGQLKMFAALVREGSWADAVIDLPKPDRKPLPRADLRRMRESLGPVIVFDASNFPLAFGAVGGDTASALATGNPVIVKTHPSHPGTNELVAGAVLKALQKCDLPAGMFTLLHGNDIATGEALVKHDGAKAVGFTGSLRGGRAIFNTAASRKTPIPVFAEMGSLNPLAILPGALQSRSETIAKALAGSITMGAGQFCTKPGLVLVVESPESTGFIKQLAEAVKATPTFTMLNAGLQKNLASTLSAFTQTLGTVPHVAGSCTGNAETTASLFEVDSATWRRQDVLHHEAFGPAAIVVRCKDVADLCLTIAAVRGSLTASVHHSDADAANLPTVVNALRSVAGRVIFNGYPTGVEVCHAMVHGGPYPATTAPSTTSVGTMAITRFTRPVCYQDAPDALLPAALQNDNPLGIMRVVDGQFTREACQASV